MLPRNLFEHGSSRRDVLMQIRSFPIELVKHGGAQSSGGVDSLVYAAGEVGA